jgi:hypothetical protein
MHEVKIAHSAEGDLLDGYAFYEAQDLGVGINCINWGQIPINRASIGVRFQLIRLLSEKPRQPNEYLPSQLSNL